MLGVVENLDYLTVAKILLLLIYVSTEVQVERGLFSSEELLNLVEQTDASRYVVEVRGKLEGLAHVLVASSSDHHLGVIMARVLDCFAFLVKEGLHLVDLELDLLGRLGRLDKSSVYSQVHRHAFSNDGRLVDLAQITEHITELLTTILNFGMVSKF